MHKIIDFFKTTFLGGILVVLPAWLAVLLLLKALVQMKLIVKPVSDHLPSTVAHPLIMSVCLLLMLCFLVGAIIRTTVGRQVKTIVEQKVLEKVPGYTVLRSVAEQIGDLEKNHGFKPALIEVNDGLAPGFIVEEHLDGRYTIFLPSSPTPASGSVLILAAARVHALDIPVTTMLGCISKWGAGSAELLAAMKSKAT